MAVVDLETGKIHGCKKYSKVWYHEKGHIKFNNSEWGAKIAYYQIFFLMISQLFISLYIVIGGKLIALFALCNTLGMFLCYIYEEVWCWSVGLVDYYSAPSHQRS